MTAVLQSDESDLVESFLTSGNYSENYKWNARSILPQARAIVGKPLLEWTNDDGLLYKRRIEDNSWLTTNGHRPLQNRSPRVKVQVVIAFFDWAATTKRAPSTGRVKAKGQLESVAMAGVRPINADDPKKPTLKIEDYALLVETLEKRSHSQHSTKREKADYAMLLWVVRWIKKGDFRGGEVLPTKDGPLTVCTCKVDEWCPLPPPRTHDVNFVAGGRAWVRIKGSPRKVRFKEVRGSPEEMLWLRKIVEEPRWGLEQFDAKLKELQKELGFRLVTRAGTESNEPLTSHTFKRTVHRELTKAKVPEAIQNKVAGWSEKSQQARRYGEPSDMEAQEVTKGVLDFEGRVRKMRKKTKAEETGPA